MKDKNKHQHTIQYNYQEIKILIIITKELTMKIQPNSIENAMHVLAALKSKARFYNYSLHSQIIAADPKNIILMKEIGLIDQLEQAIQNCISEIGLDRQYRLKQLRKRKTPIIFAETFLDVFLLQSPNLSNSLRVGYPHCGSALQFYSCYLLYTLCYNHHAENEIPGLKIPIEKNKEWMQQLQQFKKSAIVPLSLIAALGITISKQQSTKGKKNFNHVKYSHNA